MKPHEVDCFGIDSQVVKLLKCTIEDVAVHIAFDAVDMADVSVLPELPRARVFEFAHVVMSNPIGIVVEEGIAKIFQFEFVSGVYDRLYAIKLFNDDKPLTNTLLQFAHRQIARLLDIKHGRKIACLEVHLFEEELRLADGINIRGEEMVGST